MTPIEIIDHQIAINEAERVKAYYELKAIELAEQKLQQTRDVMIKEQERLKKIEEGKGGSAAK